MRSDRMGVLVLIMVFVLLLWGGLKSAQALEVSGFVNASYTYNFDDDPGSQDGTNDLRIFDTYPNSFVPNLIELVLSGGGEGSPGYTVVLNFGADTAVIDAGTSAPGELELDIQQAYLTLPWGPGSLMVGKMATLIGAEVIESPDNPNISRSFLFGFAIPFTHTGARYALDLGGVGLTVGLNNGWDNAIDDNPDKSLEAQVSLQPTEALSVSLQGMIGREANNAGNPTQRTILDLVASYTLTDRLSFLLNYDLGSQEKYDGSNDASWSGVAGYVLYTLNEQWGLALRVEQFKDDEGFRTGTAQTLTEETLTLSWAPAEATLVRFEYRHDASDEAVFKDGDGKNQKSQDTLAVEFVYRF